MNPFISAHCTSCRCCHLHGLAQALHLPDPYWAPISAIVCSLDAFEGASTTARRRLRELFWVCWQASKCVHGLNLLSYGFAIAVLGLLCSALRLHPSSLRFGAIALTVVASDSNQSGVWLTAGARFVDVALGISVALVVVKAWPKRSHQS